MEEINFLTLQLAKKYTDEHGGGGGGTSNYNDLSNKPQIGGVTLSGNKSASDLGLVAAETGKGLSENDYTDADKAIVGGVTAALAGKQGALTAGKYIDIDANNEISVDRVIPNEAFTYRIHGGNGTIYVDKIVNGAVVHTETHATGEFDPPITYDNAITVTYYNAGSMKYELLIASDSHEVGYVQTWAWWHNVDFTETFSTVDHSGEKLIIKSELDTAIGAIKDGQSIDSFADVETALASKQDALTFDDVPTDNSNNPVKSNGIYDALAGKQDIFERISYANWQLLSPQQQAAKPYYIYDYPNSGTVQAANVAYSNTSSGLSATTAQGGIDELASEKQDKTDNNLTTTNKTVVGGINELKSGLTNVTTQCDTTTASITINEDLTSESWYPCVVKKRNGYCYLQGILTVKANKSISKGDIILTINDESFRSNQNTGIAMVVGSEAVYPFLIMYNGDVKYMGSYTIQPTVAIQLNALWDARG